MLTRKVCLVIVLILSIKGSTGQDVRAQEKSKSSEQDQAIRLKTELLEVRAVVTDKQGRLVDNLKAEDFELLENGRPQPIVFFSKERMRRKPDDDTTEIKEAPAQTARPRPDASVGRTIVFFVDTLHLSPTSFLRVKRMLRQFITEQLTDNDLAAIVTSGGRMGLFNQFTKDRRILLYAVNKLSVGGQAVSNSKFTPYLASSVDRSDPEALNLAIEIMRVEEGIEIMDRRIAQEMARAKARMILSLTESWRKVALLTLKEVAKRMAELPGQRMIAFISDGFSLVDNGGTLDTGELNRTINRAVVSGVIIYSLFAKGLEPPSVFDASGRTPLSNSLFSYMSSSEKDLQNGMNALAHDTGGEFFFNTNDMGGALKKALDNNDVYYVLAYYPAIEGNDNKYRRLSVKVKNNPDLAVRAQKGYLTADLKPEKSKATQSPKQKMFEAIASPLPATAIGISASAEFLETDADDAQATLLVHIDATTIEYKQQDKKYEFNLELVTLIFDETGKVAKTVANNVQGSMTAERLELAKQNGFRYGTRVSLKPGKYQARVGILESSTERIGSAMSLLEIPDLKKKKLAISGLFLSEVAADEQRAQMVGSQDFYQTRVARGIPFFKTGSTLACSFMAYNAAAASEKDSEAMMQAAILQDGQVIYQDEWKPIRSKQVVQGKKGILIGLQHKVAMKPGLYELRIMVKEPKSKKPIEQSVMFEIVP